MKKKALLIILILFLSSYSVSSIELTIENKENIGSEKHFAVIIGTNYNSWTTSSAIEFKNSIDKDGYWDEIKLLSGFDATKNNIERQISWLISKSYGGTNTLLFYLIGHSGTSFFETSDGKVIYDSDFVKYFQKITSRFGKNKLILIFETCYSGRFCKEKENRFFENIFRYSFLKFENFLGFFKNTIYPLDKTKNLGILNNLVKPGRILITSCNTNELAYKGHYNIAAFTNYIKDAINDYDLEKIEDIFKIAKENTIIYADSFCSGPQTPQIIDRCDGKIRIV